MTSTNTEAKRTMITREEYVRLFQSTALAMDFESCCLSIGSEYLPEHAVLALSGSETAPEYWQWLSNQHESMLAEFHGF